MASSNSRRPVLNPASLRRGRNNGREERNLSFSHRLRQIDFHSLVNANLEAGEADHALLWIVGDFPALSIHVQRAGGANGHTGGTSGAAFLDVLDVLGKGLNAHSQLFEIVEGESYLTLLTAQFHNHSALFSRVNAGPKDIDDQVIVLDESIRDRLFHIARRE
jgi:hypothetical protein